MIFPKKETLRAMVTGNQVNGGYLLVAVFLHQLVDDGATFYLSETHIKFSAAGVCDWCQIRLHADDRISAYYIDIITPNLTDDEY